MTSLKTIIRFPKVLVKLLIQPRYRSEQYSRRKYRTEIFQVSTYTRAMRYPELFGQVAKMLEHISSPEILSFGCSTGKEIQSLQLLLPSGNFTGVDINPRCIRKAKRRTKEDPPYSFANNRVDFYHSKSEEWAGKERYDCILALAVFQKTENRLETGRESHASFQFRDFEKGIARLNAMLKPGGMLVLEHCDYRFSDTQLSNRYKAGPGIAILRKRPLFDKENKMIRDPEAQHRIFIKQA